MSKTITYLLAAPAICAWVAFALWANAFAIKTLWAWFAAPAFGLAEISLPMALGLAVLLRQLGCAIGPHCAPDPKRKYLPMLDPILRPAFALLIGWIALQFI